MHARHETMSVGMWALVASVASLSLTVGCAETPDENMVWETYSVKRNLLAQERDKLADVVREVLIHRRFFPELERTLETPGTLGRLVTGWNDEEARVPQGSLQGHRYKVVVQLTENVEHLKPKTDDPVYARLRKELASRKPDEMPLALGLRCLREVNTAMNYRPGDYERAEFKGDGDDAGYAARLLAEIRRRFNAIAANPEPGMGEGSRIGREIIERGTDIPDDERPGQPRRYGPHETKPSGNSDLDFGTSQRH